MPCLAHAPSSPRPCICVHCSRVAPSCPPPISCFARLRRFRRSSLANPTSHLTSLARGGDAALVTPAHSHDAVTRLTALVVAPGCSEKQILAELRQRIDAAFLPRPLQMVDALPRNAVGKLPQLALEDLTQRLTAKAG